MIYFVSNGNGAIKVGYTSNLEQRLAAFRTTMPTLSVIATMDGTPGHERSLHNELSAYRLIGEWFSDCEYVRKVMAHALQHGISEWKSPRKDYIPTEWDGRALQLAEIICEGKSTHQVDALEEAFGIPPATIWKLKYRQNREVSAGEYFALLRAAGLVIALKREDLARQSSFVEQLQAEEAAKSQDLANIESDLRAAKALLDKG